MMTNKNLELPKTLERFRDKIDDVSDERGSGDGYWVFLKDGWRTSDEVVHAVHEDTITACAREMRCVIECVCVDCMAALAERKELS